MRVCDESIFYLDILIPAFTPTPSLSGPCFTGAAPSKPSAFPQGWVEPVFPACNASCVVVTLAAPLPVAEGGAPSHPT